MRKSNTEETLRREKRKLNRLVRKAIKEDRLMLQDTGIQQQSDRVDDLVVKVQRERLQAEEN